VKAYVAATGRISTKLLASAWRRPDACDQPWRALIFKLKKEYGDAIVGFGQYFDRRAPLHPPLS